MQSANDKDNEDGWLAAIEDDYLQSIGAEPDYGHQYVMERDASMRAMWGSFQESATSIAQLYRDRLSTNETGALWLPFQTAAGTVTSLYKESSEGLRRTSETAIQSGYQRRTRELADWARKKNRRYIRREELLAYLAGKPPPPLHGPKHGAGSPHGHHLNHHPHHHPGHHHGGVGVCSGGGGGGGGGNHGGHNHNSHHHHSHNHHTNGANNTSTTTHSTYQAKLPAAHHRHHDVDDEEPDDAYHLGGAANAQQQYVDDPCALGSPVSGPDGEQLNTFKEALARRTRAPDLYAFVTDEIARHSKRPASPPDINMDAQQNIGGKRQRFL